MLLLLIKWTEFCAVGVGIYYTGLCVAFVTVLKGVRYGQRELEDKSLQRKSEGGGNIREVLTDPHLNLISLWPVTFCQISKHEMNSIILFSVITLYI